MIESSRYKDASEGLDNIEKMFRADRIHKDIHLGLRCKLCLKQDNWHEAEIHWKQLRQKDLPVHLGLRGEILSQKIYDPTTSPSEREDAERELQEIGDIINIPLYVPEEEDEALHIAEDEHE